MKKTYQLTIIYEGSLHSISALITHFSNEAPYKADIEIKEVED